MSLDLRLALPAAAVWLSSGLLIGAPEAAESVAVTLWLLAGGCSAALLVSRLPRRSTAGSAVRRENGTRKTSQKSTSSRNTGTPSPDRWQKLGGSLVLCCAGAALVATAIGVWAPVRLPAEVRAAAQSHATVTAIVTVWSVPVAAKAFIGSGTSGRVRYRATLTQIDGNGASAQVSSPVVVFAEAAKDGDEPQIGVKLRVRATLRTTEPGDAAVALLFVTGSAASVAPPPWWLHWSNDVRARFMKAATTLSGDGGDLLPGLAIGDTSAVSSALDTAMKTSSLSHLTAVSGANCAIVIASIMLLGGYLRLRRSWRIALSLLTLLGFTVLVTPEPSVLRSAVMATLTLLSIGAGRPGRGVPTLLGVVIGLLAFDPWLARNYGFALSVLATAGLLLLAGPLGRVLARWMPGALAAIIAIPLAAQLACQPVLILLNPSLPLYGVPANILAGPAAPIATVVGLVACLTLTLLPGVASGLLALAWLPSAWIAAVAQGVSTLPGTRLPWPGGALGVLLLSVATLLTLVVVLRGPAARPARWPAAVLAVLLVGLGGYAGSLIGTGLGRVVSFPSDWQIAACDIGQGDAVVVRDGDQYGLVDVGPDPQLLTNCLATLGITHIDLLVLTHYDLDHIGGVDAVIGRVDTALVGVPENAEDERLHERLAAGGATVSQAARGDAGTLGSLRWNILWPLRGATTMQVGNPGSLTIMFDGRGIRSIFLGDLGQEAQDALRRVSPPGRVDVVKVAHHGSADQSTELYADLRARVGLISVGVKNSYGHPTDTLLNILASVGTLAVRTDREGMAVIAPGANGTLVLWAEKVSGRAPPATPAASAPTVHRSAERILTGGSAVRVRLDLPRTKP
ncbi:ComEC/Rec2 family competence protein [Cryobacterium sp. PH29-G1]|uniref:ComEC/Rec2 family competence protein n=1 Tax=Cryobacterium sp. PH29-G1 TaxID=3046211 RepID=UPI0024B92252|nr:ComEC/Rec2 family competence protein [Cryobacterium sp. PH29-G1]MDJ0348480.1 ComEC/Rec2 family competence protein [Cryobacterium sp. PH29-G1]